MISRSCEGRMVGQFLSAYNIDERKERTEAREKIIAGVTREAVGGM